MPYRKTYNRKKKKTTTKRRYTRKVSIGRPPRASNPALYKFKRCLTETIIINTSSPPEGWAVSGNMLYKQFVFSLSQLGDSTDFTNLFSQYKITSVKQEFLFSNTNSIANSGYSNKQLIIWTDRNPSGVNETISESQMLTSQTAKKRLCLNGGSIIKYWSPVKQLNQVYAGIANSDYAMQSPKFIGTSEPGTPHYGINMLIGRVDGQTMPHVAGELSQYCKIITTVYLTCRKVE